MKNQMFSIVLSLVITCVSTSAMAFPGLLQLASRAGFWANDFPDTGIYVGHYYYYNADEIWDTDGNELDIQDMDINAVFNRAIRAWHFGEQEEYQYVLEFIVPLYNISGEDMIVGTDIQPAFSESGLGSPYLYQSLGWNNPSKTTHLQAALAWQVPLGDDDLASALGFGNNHALMPLVGFQQRMGSLWFDASLGYMYNFEDLDSDAKTRDYLEVNSALSYRLDGPLPWWVYVQGDYTKYEEGNGTDGMGLGNEGFNLAVAPGIGVAIRPNMTLDVKYTMDVDGESTLKGSAINFRFFWVL